MNCNHSNAPMISPFENGTVIDHIVPGKAILFLRLLGLETYPGRISIGLNLSSHHYRQKDLIKVEGWEIDKENASRIALFSPQATINIIKDFKVINKYRVPLPTKIEGFLRCPNGNCVTNHEPVIVRFTIIPQPKMHFLQCQFCEKRFSSHEISC